MATKKERKPRTPKPAGERKTHVVTDRVKAAQCAERIERLRAERDRKIENAPLKLRTDYSIKIARELAPLTPRQRELTELQLSPDVAPTEHDTKAEEAAQ